MAQAKKYLFSGENTGGHKTETKSEKVQNLLNKRSVEKLVTDINKRLKDPSEAKKAASILAQWLEESPAKPKK